MIFKASYLFYLLWKANTLRDHNTVSQLHGIISPVSPFCPTIVKLNESPLTKDERPLVALWQFFSFDNHLCLFLFIFSRECWSLIAQNTICRIIASHVQLLAVYVVFKLLCQTKWKSLQTISDLYFFLSHCLVVMWQALLWKIYTTLPECHNVSSEKS